jgi:hypothetical protein
METLSPLAGKPAPREMLVDLSKLERAYFDTSPDVEDPNQLVHFGTSGHRGSSLRASFNEAPAQAAVGKTLVSSQMIDRVVEKVGRRLWETPVGFKWFVPGLMDGSVCFGGEESAGASFLRRDGTVWTTDKDGLIMDLLAAEITARTDKDPGEHFQNWSLSLAGLITRESTSLPPRSRSETGRAGAGICSRVKSCRRTDHCEADQCPG